MTEEVVGKVLREVRRRLAARAGTGYGGEGSGGVGEAGGSTAAGDPAAGEAIVSKTETPHGLVRMMGETEERLAVVEERTALFKERLAMANLDARRLAKGAGPRLADLRGLEGRNPKHVRRVVGVLLAAPLLFEGNRT